MDKIIKKKRFSKRNIFMGAGIIAVLCLVIYGYTLSLNKIYRAHTDKVTISKVEYGDFEDVVLLNATVVPLTSLSNYISSETSIIEQINQLPNLRLDLEQNHRVMKQDMMVD